jgi:hypothetical protein
MEVVSLVSFKPPFAGEENKGTPKHALFSRWGFAGINSPNSPVVCNSLKEKQGFGEFLPFCGGFVRRDHQNQTERLGRKAG